MMFPRMRQLGRRVVIAVIAMAAVLAIPPLAMACSGAPLLEEGLTYEERAGVVFTGTAVRVEDPWSGLGGTHSTFDLRRWTFAVDEVEKGDVGERFTVASTGSASCGMQFQLGIRYRVIAWDVGRGLEVFTANGTEAMPPLASPPPVEGTFTAGPPIVLIVAGLAAAAITAAVLYRRLARGSGVRSAA